MNSDPVGLHFLTIRQYLARLPQEDAGGRAKIEAMLEDLYAQYEEMQTSGDS
ncbi:MAG: hypothetical protein NW224_16400 [Leptolyngbyaceae cyanobacterium bins.302]|nr:hypothetical protein [Leptolyngbyaceae cyanobacterium bins.302]